MLANASMCTDDLTISTLVSTEKSDLGAAGNLSIYSATKKNQTYMQFFPKVIQNILDSSLNFTYEI